MADLKTLEEKIRKKRDEIIIRNNLYGEEEHDAYKVGIADALDYVLSLLEKEVKNVSL